MFRSNRSAKYGLKLSNELLYKQDFSKGTEAGKLAACGQQPPGCLVARKSNLGTSVKFKGRPIPLSFWAFHSIEQGFCKWILRVCTCLDLQLIRVLAGIEHAAPHA